MYFTYNYFNDFPGVIPKDFFARYFKNQLIANGKLLLKTDVSISSVNIGLDGSLNIKDIRIKTLLIFLKIISLNLKIYPSK